MVAPALRPAPIPFLGCCGSAAEADLNSAHGVLPSSARVNTWRVASASAPVHAVGSTSSAVVTADRGAMFQAADAVSEERDNDGVGCELGAMARSL